TNRARNGASTSIHLLVKNQKRAWVPKKSEGTYPRELDASTNVDVTAVRTQSRIQKNVIGLTATTNPSSKTGLSYEPSACFVKCTRLIGCNPKTLLRQQSGSLNQAPHFHVGCHASVESLRCRSNNFIFHTFH